METEQQQQTKFIIDYYVLKVQYEDLEHRLETAKRENEELKSLNQKLMNENQSLRYDLSLEQQTSEKLLCLINDPLLNSNIEFNMDYDFELYSQSIIAPCN